MGQEIIIALLSGLMGAICASILTALFSFKLLKKDFNLKNKKEYFEKLITWTSSEYESLNDELEKIKETEWGKCLSKIEKKYKEKLIEIKETKEKFSIQEDLSLLYLENIFLKKALADFQKKTIEIREDLLNFLKNRKGKYIQTIEKKLNELKYEQLKIITIAKKELKQ